MNHPTKISVSALLLFTLLSTYRALGMDLNEAFDRLKTIPEDYSSFGTICDRVGKLELEEFFPAYEYEILIGVEYRYNSRILGELDLVVFRRSDGEAIMITEVKCSSSFKRALEKAHGQLQRFVSAISSGKDIKIYLKKDRSRVFRIDQFDENPEILTMSQKYGTRAGFDLEIGLSLEQARDLRDRLVRCQFKKQCPSIAKYSYKKVP